MHEPSRKRSVSQVLSIPSDSVRKICVKKCQRLHDSNLFDGAVGFLVENSKII